MQDKILDNLWQLLLVNLEYSSPVLSGNMKNSIVVSELKEHRVKLVISPKFYDLTKWRKTGVIVRKKPEGETRVSYANAVNNYGGFNTHNDSEHWVNRCCYEVANAIKREIEAKEKVKVEVVNELEL